MDYKKREYRCPTKKDKNLFSYEMAYELGCDYLEDLVERKQDYLNENNNKSEE